MECLMARGERRVWAVATPPTLQRADVDDEEARGVPRVGLMVKGSEIGGFGGGSLEQLRPWLGSQWPWATPGVPGCTGPPGAP